MNIYEKIFNIVNGASSFTIFSRSGYVGGW